ncbi:hypothetical protein POTOM_018013 [Populus tomentosa]|uniref:OTU domain-containing protein n=1 Tax=Populus tomentosa TaxID=118781 RepID=A0A8X8CW84_POPTO|nr:hypothetical protein POTOM_018013 [Populus tomentosa]
MTRILVQRGSGSSSNQSRAGSSSSAARPDTQGTSILQAVSTPKDEDVGEEVQEQVVVDEFLENSGSHDNKVVKSDELLMGSINGDRSDSLNDEIVDNDKVGNEEGVGSGDSVKGLGGLILERSPVESEGSSSNCPENGSGSPQPPPPPVPPPKPDLTNSNSRRFISGTSNSVRIGSSRRAVAWPVVSTRSSPTGSRPSSPRSHGENEGYNSADEQNPCFVSSYDDFELRLCSCGMISSRFMFIGSVGFASVSTWPMERERQFEIDIRRSKGLEVKRMLEDGNCLFRAVTDQVYGDSEMYDLARQMCVDYMERERDHFSQFITEGFTSYCKRKRRDKEELFEASQLQRLQMKDLSVNFLGKFLDMEALFGGFSCVLDRVDVNKYLVYGNNVEIQALSEMYNRPIHIYSYSTEPINIGSYNTDTPPIQLSYHHGNHYNSLVNPRRSTIGAGLGFSCLQGDQRTIEVGKVHTDELIGIAYGKFPHNPSSIFPSTLLSTLIFIAVKASIVKEIDVADTGNNCVCRQVWIEIRSKLLLKLNKTSRLIMQALLAEGQFYSDLEVTEKEIERMVMEASRAEYLSDNKFKPQLGRKGSFTSGAEPSSSGARSSSASETTKVEGAREHGLQDTVLSSSMQIVLSMGFSYLQAIEAYSIFGDDVDSMVCYLVETSSSSSSRRKGKATE